VRAARASVAARASRMRCGMCVILLDRIGRPCRGWRDEKGDSPRRV
jgi:hypothetical protein